MEPKFVPIIGQLVDTLYSFNLFYNYNNILQYKTSQGIFEDKTVSKICDDILSKCSFDNYNVDLFFVTNPNSNSVFIIDFLKDKLWDCINVAALVKYLREVDTRVLAQEFIAFCDTSKKNTAFYTELCSSSYFVTNYINGIKISDKIKWQLICLLNTPDIILDRLCTAITEVSKVVEQVHHEFNDRIWTVEASIVSQSQKDNQLTSRSFDGTIKNYPVLETDSVVYSVSVINDLFYSIKYEKEIYYVIAGINNNMVISRDVYAGLDISVSGNALGDPIRLNMLLLIKEKNMYMREMSRAMDIPAPTAAYHLDILAQAKLLNLNATRKKVFYSINKDAVNSLALSLIDLAK